MRALIQCVKKASVKVEDKIVGKIDRGYLIFLGVGTEDGPEEVEKLWNKINKLRIWEDNEGKTNWNLEKVGGSCLIVSQFTLYANCRKGNRPSFVEAAGGEKGKSLYESFIEAAKKDVPIVEHGIFGAEMDVELINEGPFTIWLDTEEL